MANQRELHTSDIRGRAKPQINLDMTIDEIRDNEKVIIETESLTIEDSYLNELAFMEEILTIRIEPSADRYSPKFIDVAVNGDTQWLPVGEAVKVKRKYVEVLARSKSDTFITVAPSTSDENPVNLLSRNTSQKYPFSVIKDTNPAGYNWLTKVLSQ